MYELHTEAWRLATHQLIKGGGWGRRRMGVIKEKVDRPDQRKVLVETEYSVRMAIGRISSCQHSDWVGGQLVLCVPPQYLCWCWWSHCHHLENTNLIWEIYARWKFCESSEGQGLHQLSSYLFFLVFRLFYYYFGTIHDTKVENDCHMSDAFSTYLITIRFYLITVRFVSNDYQIHSDFA